MNTAPLYLVPAWLPTTGSCTGPKAQFACSAVGKDLLAYMVLAANPLCSPALNRVFNKPTRGIGQAGWQQLQTQLAADPAAPTLPAFLFQDLDDVWVAPEVVQRVCPPSRAMHAPLRI